MPGKVHIHTVGCQMSVLDSELVAGTMRRQGWSLADSPEGADVVLFNTCSIRESVEEKTYAEIAKIKGVKARNPSAIVGVLGCMAQKDQHAVFERAPHVDLVVGPGALGDVPDLVEEIRRTRERRSSFALGRGDGPRREVEESFASFDPDRETSAFQAFVRTQTGCDKFCTYCIVPSVRGPEQSRSAASIREEAQRLADQGVVEITLVGQTVNSWRHGKDRFADLLACLNEVAGIERIRFTSSFPNDMTDDVLAAVRDLPKLAKHLHVPAQSGSDAVLARMKRHYTSAEYREMVARARAAIPGVTVSGDFIVGFCGETDEDFAATIALLRETRLKSSYIYQYSPRSGTRAHAELADDVPDDVKRARNNELLSVQGDVSREITRGMIGRVVDVLVEGPSKLSHREGLENQLFGKTGSDHAVVFDGPRALAGRFVRVLVEDATSLTLFGRIEGAVPEARAAMAPRPRLPVVLS